MSKSSGNSQSIFRRIMKIKEVSILIPLILICVITTIGNSSFLYPDNIISLLRSVSLTTIGALGMSFVLATGAFDLSVGSTYAFGAVIAGTCMVKGGISWPIAFIIGLAVGCIVGLINGLIITKLSIPPLITTLGMQYIVRGIINVMTHGSAVTGFPEGFKILGGGKIGDVPISVFIALGIVILCFYVFKYTVYGRQVLAVGGNKETARVSGINVQRIEISTYVVAGFAAALVGLLTASRLATAQSNAGDGWEMTLIASAVIGGTSLFGGNFTAIGTVIGVGIMEVLTVATTLLKVDTYYQKIIVGVIIILAVGIDMAQRKRRERG